MARQVLMFESTQWNSPLIRDLTVTLDQPENMTNLFITNIFYIIKLVLLLLGKTIITRNHQIQTSNLLICNFKYGIKFYFRQEKKS